VIARAARRDWRRFGLPSGIDEVVDALFELPPDQVLESAVGAIERPNWHVAHGRVDGRLYVAGGLKNAEGEWIAVLMVAPVD